MKKVHRKTPIPRTLRTALSRGYDVIDTHFGHFTNAQLDSYIPLDQVGTRKGHLVGFTQDAQHPDCWLAEYRSDDGNSTFVSIPKGQNIPDEN